METKEGTLKVKIKNNGSRDSQKTHILIGKDKKPISKEFLLTNEMNNENCTVYMENNEIVDIEIDGTKIDKGEKKEKVKPIPRCENKDNMRIPNDTCLILQDSNIQIDNFSLKLYRFAIFDEDKGYKLQKNYSIEKSAWTEINPKITNYYENIKALFGENTYQEELETSYRLVIGGEATVYETSMRLHHIYGIPYIPASGIKGVVRSYIILEKFSKELEKYKDNYNKFEDEVLFQCDWFVDIFGSQESEGKVIFVDAFPTNKPTIKVDIMNPHYGDYYSKGKAPTDTMKLNPINFLTVENTTFEFFIASKESLEAFKIKEKTLIEWFQEALQNHGIGAKTAVGYGYFEEQ